MLGLCECLLLVGSMANGQCGWPAGWFPGCRLGDSAAAAMVRRQVYRLRLMTQSSSAISRSILFGTALASSSAWSTDFLYQRARLSSAPTSTVGPGSDRDAYLKNGGLLEHAQTVANHFSPRATKLYDRRSDGLRCASGG
jgi:hypothetical protein